MMNRTRILLVLGLAVAVLAAGLFFAHQVLASNLAAAITLPARWSYAASFVCGLAGPFTGPAPMEAFVKPGNYATLIQLHNPGAAAVTLWKKVVLNSPETFPTTTAIAPTKRFVDRLKPDHGMSIDCSEIVNLLLQNGTPVPPNQTFIQGFVVIDSAAGPATALTLAPLDVFATYTAAPEPVAGTVQAVNSVSIVPIPGRSLPAGTWPF
jgi:hypothetical protein